MIPMNIDIHGETIWIESHADSKFQRGILKPIMAPVQSSIVVVHRLKDTLADSFGDAKGEISKSLTSLRVSIPKIDMQFDSAQLAHLVDLFADIFSEPLPFQEALDEKLSNILHRGQLISHPQEHAQLLIRKHNRLRWEIDFVKFMIEGIKEDNDEKFESIELNCLHDTLKDCSSEREDVQFELNKILLVCKMRENELREIESSNSDKKIVSNLGLLENSTDLTFSVDQFRCGLVQSHRKECFLSSELNGLMFTANLGDFKSIGPKKPKQIKAFIEIADWIFINHLSQDHWNLLLSSNVETWNDKRIFFGFGVELKDVGGITVLSCIEANIIPLKVLVTNGNYNFILVLLFLNM